ncbi:hypothetical protein H3Z83_07150 [Tenacibaculum sp. S7007]|uniref:Uncharacterized protein n=1 Tax=Tenacibaculum pelagium TaxID=2759527 RepID=A0A839APL1_9FLAO|nr:hypothetical protein [Tenacibaculum pelagium]MBA6156288.1 hypothetical protein [Tenacibaculum pelagium]
MSNPAVIILSECRTKRNESFRVEDNIGESIHIHYENLRFDLTINDLLKLADFLRQVINGIVDNENFQVECFDPVFLKHVGEYLNDIKKIEIVNVDLHQLEVNVKNFIGLPIVSKLKKSIVYKAIKGDDKAYINYSQENDIFMTNEERLLGVKNYLNTHEYPYNNEYIVLFNNQNIIRDGQHRASILLSKKNKYAEVVRIHFKNDKANLSKHPYLKYIFHWNTTRVKNVLRFFWRHYKNLKYRLEAKIKRSF